jgi:hypothetical protein
MAEERYACYLLRAIQLKEKCVSSQEIALMEWHISILEMCIPKF